LFIICLLISATVLFYAKYERIAYETLIERFNVIKYSILWVENEQLEQRICAPLTSKESNCPKQIVKTNKWFGYGLGNFMRITPYSQYAFLEKTRTNMGLNPQHRYEHVHNDYVEVFFEMGRLGFISLMMIILNMFYRVYRAKKTILFKISFCCVLAQMIAALGIYTVHTAVSGMLLIIFYGILEGELKGGLCHGTNAGVV